ncbi:MAG TPA: hypothetical protein V6D47_05695, partial [Oscillatoriaceae cyanobacterium]
MRKTSLFASMLACFLVASPALASTTAGEGEQATVTQTKLGGELFTNYAAPTTGFALPGFAVTRARIFADVRYNDTWSGAIITNVSGLTYDSKTKTTTQPNVLDLERAFVQAENLLPNTRLQMGMIETPWFEYEAVAWGYRMLGLLPDAGGLSPDRRGPSIVTFYDYGLGLTGHVPALNNPNLVSYSLAVLNGEGYNHVKSAADMSYEGRLTLSPLPGLELTGMVHRAHPTADIAPVNREAALAVYHLGGAKVAFEGNWVQDQTSASSPETNGNILGAWVIVPIPAPLPTELILRGDRITGNQTTLDANQGFRYETIAGLAVTPVKGVRFVLDNQNIDYHNADGTPNGNEDI